jgi:hypothetical protein
MQATYSLIELLNEGPFAHKPIVLRGHNQST